MNCDCLNDCGDDDRLKTGKVQPCEHMAARLERQRVISEQVATITQLRNIYGADNIFELIEKMHAKVFAAIHVEKLKLASGEAIVEWIGKNGVDSAKFLAEYNSFGVVTKTQRASQLQNAYKVEGVPALGVAGRYYTDGSMAKSMERALQVVDTLVDTMRTGTTKAPKKA